MTEADDLEAFIQERKAQIAKERQIISKQEPTKERRRWERRPPAEILATSNHDNHPETPEESGLAFEGYGYEEHRKKLLEERRKEYNELLREQPPGTKQPSDSPAYGALLVNTDDEKQKKLQEERKKEYNELMQKARVTNQNKENMPPSSETPELGFIAKLGEYEQKRKKLQEERKREYNELLAMKKEKIVPPWLQNEEPHNFENADMKLNAKEGRKKRGEDEQLGLLNGLSDRSVDQEKKRRSQEEYKEYLNKQLKEQHSKHGQFKPYARHDAELSDDDSPRGRSKIGNEEDFATLPGIRDHASAEIRKMQERNREYNEYLNAKKQAGRARSRYPDSDEDDRPVPRKGWATPTYEEILEKKRREERSYRRRYDPEYASGLRSSRSESNLHRALPDPFEDDERRFRNLDREYESKKVHFRTDKQHVNPELEFSEWSPKMMLPPRPKSLQPERTRHRAERIPSRYDNRSPDIQVPNSHYHERHPLDKPHSYSKPSTEHYGATLPIGSEQRASAEQRKKEAYRRELEQQMRELREKRTRERLDEVKPYTVSSRLERPEYPERKDMPPQQPLSSHWREDLSSLGAYRTPMDDAYMYYANRNPLDIAGVGLDPLVPLNRPLERPPERTMERPKVTFNDSMKPDSYRETAPARTPFPMDDNRSRAQKDAQRVYQEELKRQIEEQRLLKQKEKEERERYEKKLDEEIMKYDPFGRGGGGAPMRDTEGNVIADRRQLRVEASDPYKAVQPPPESSHPPTVVKKAEPDGESFARGGHGIFGEPLSDAEKMKRNRYQEELRKQIEEQKRLQELEKAKLKEEEERLMKKIEEEQRKMQEELEAERRKEREKQEAAQRQQEELRRQQEERRKEEERRRQEAEERRQEELRRQEEEQRKERQQQDQKRGISPPVPAIRSKTEPPASPPVPAQRTHSRPQSRIASADVLNQLSRMRQQLQIERKRVESDLKQEQDEPEVFDPRLQTKAPSRNNVDVFEIARKKEAAPVRRPPVEANPKNIDDFRSLKNKEGTSRSEFRKLFPQTPNTDDALETQQRALLMQQEEHLKDLRERKVPEDQLNTFGRNSRNKRNDSARSRHRLRSNTSMNTRADSVGSLTSLDPDVITRKNEDRLRKLKSLAGDDASLASADPDEVLDRFMAKQQHARPPSEQTLIDDSWMQPETKVT